MIINFSHVYNIVIDSGIGEPGHGKYVVDGFNDTGKMFLSILMTAVKLPGAPNNNSQMVRNTSMSNAAISLARVLKKLLYPTRTNGLIDNR